MLRRNVLIFHLGALGDFVLSWPLALALGRTYPQSRIIYITHGQKGALAEQVLRLESNDVENGWHALFAQNAGELPPRAAGLLAGAHAVYTFLTPSSHWSANVAARQPAARVVSIEPRAPDDFNAHASDWLLHQLREHAVERAATEQILRSIADRSVGFRRATGGEVVIHPGSGSPAKCWPIERFIKLAHQFRSAGHHVRFVIGEVERERWSAQQIDALSSSSELRTPSTYLELLGEISTAAVFIGNDSGPGHLAGIIGVPTVSIFGPTDPARWKPLGPAVGVARGQSLQDVSVDAVLDAAMSLIESRVRQRRL